MSALINPMLSLWHISFRTIDSFIIALVHTTTLKDNTQSEQQRRVEETSENDQRPSSVVAGIKEASLLLPSTWY